MPLCREITWLNCVASSGMLGFPVELICIGWKHELIICDPICLPSTSDERVNSCRGPKYCLPLKLEFEEIPIYILIFLQLDPTFIGSFRSHWHTGMWDSIPNWNLIGIKTHSTVNKERIYESNRVHFINSLVLKRNVNIRILSLPATSDLDYLI